MNIVMVTNTFTPHVGGVARSVSTFTEEFRRRGHRVLVVAPTFPGHPAEEADVVRVRALQKFNGSDFSVVLAPSRRLTRAVDAFSPDIVHSHHPFLLGSTAMRLARRHGAPLVFTHHTFFERYTHYVRPDSAALKRFAVRLATNYANLSAEIFAPSKGVAAILAERQVRTPIRVVPTGIPVAGYRGGDGAAFRRGIGLPEGAMVVGTVGRLAEEKNLGFLARALARFLAAHPAAFGLIVGEGPSRGAMAETFARAGVGGRVRFAGILEGAELVSAYKAMDVFAFSSLSETQGLVLAEAMAAGVPVVALEATGVNDLLCDGENGRLLPAADEAAFAAALAEIAESPPARRERFRAAALATGRAFGIDRAADLALAAYAELLTKPAEAGGRRLDEAWHRSVRRLKAEWDLASAAMGAASVALQRRSPEA